MNRFYLGVDGGQSSTAALICDETGRVVGRGHGGPCNHAGSAEGRTKFLNAMGACLNEACRQAGLDPQLITFASVCLGLSGGAEDKEKYARELIRSQRYKVTHDAEIALTGGTAGEPGIIVIAGTGSIAFGRNAQGQTARAGGWGYVFGDEGGAFDLVRQALRAALRYEEGWGPATTLHKVLLEVSGAPAANVLLHRFYNQFDRTAIAQLALHVTSAAELGDQVALEVVANAASQLAAYADGVHRTLFNGKVISVVYVGGVFNSAALLAEFRIRIAQLNHCITRAPIFSPAAGALIEALRLAGNHQPLADLPPAEG